jgi:phosphoribosylformylglycinamidine synthase
MPARFGILVFPGSNCDHDAFCAAQDAMGQEARYIWHKETDLGEVDAVLVPGGFSYGDHLRAGAIAQFSPVMKAVKDFAAEGGLVAGICNGFQVLCESGLLPGALMQNERLRFVCKEVGLTVETAATPFTNAMQEGQRLRVPVAHGEGRFYAGEDTLDHLEANRQVLFRYAEGENPNGSVRGIAGITNERGNVLGLMPHPERCADPLVGSGDGQHFFESIIAHVEERGEQQHATHERQPA